MMVEVKLENQLGYKWFCSREVGKEVWVKGFLIKDEHIYSAQEFLNYASACTRENLIDCCREADGHFLIVVCDNEGAIVISDHMRSFPVLIVKRENGYCVTDVVTDDITSHFEIDSLQKSAFENALFTFEEKTLYKDITQVPAGAYCTISEAGLAYEDYWQFCYAENPILDEKQAVATLTDSYDELFTTCKELIGERQVAIPLSGGYDSRLVLSGLLRNGVAKEKIITFTYGRDDYEDGLLSAQIAKAVGVRHYFIDYCTKEARKFFKKEFASFSNYAAMAISVPCIQEWYAVSVLKQRGIVHENCVFAPGYGGLLVGNCIRDFMFEENADIKAGIEQHIKRTMLLNKPKSSVEEKQKLQEMLLHSKYFKDNDGQSDHYVEAYERLRYAEQQSKYILNAVRAYENVGCEWITPFFFKMQYDVWCRIDNTLRFQNKAFIQCMESYFLPELKEIPFTGSKVKKNPKKQPKLLRLALSILQMFFNRTKSHYLFGMVPGKIYYKLFFINRLTVSINHLVGYEYYKMLTKHKKK